METAAETLAREAYAHRQRLIGLAERLVRLPSYSPPLRANLSIGPSLAVMAVAEASGASDD